MKKPEQYRKKPAVVEQIEWSYKKVRHFPKYQFAAAVTPVTDWFAWHPIRLWYGRWVWLKPVARQRFSKRRHLDGPDWEFWSYADAAPQILRKE